MKRGITSKGNGKYVISENGLPVFAVTVISPDTVLIDGKGSADVYNVVHKGTHWQMTKTAAGSVVQEPYAVVIRQTPGIAQGCECWAGLRHGYCRHQTVIRGLLAVGALVEG